MFFIICYLIIFRDIYILDIYNKFPPLKGDFHCTHPTTVTTLAQLAKMEHCGINPENIMTALIKKWYSATLKYLQWPTILTFTTIGSKVVRQPDELKWWLLLPSLDEGDNESDGDDELQGNNEPQGDENVDMDDGKTFYFICSSDILSSDYYSMQICHATLAE